MEPNNLTSEHEMFRILKSGKHNLSRQDTEELVFRTLTSLMKKREFQSIERILKQTFQLNSRKLGLQSSHNILKRIEVFFKIRKPTIAIYDHNFHFIGGGQKYGLTTAHTLQDKYEVTLIASREVSHDNFLNWYNLDLSNCNIKIVKLPFFDDTGVDNFDPVNVTKRTINPFHAISRESGNYDVFINSNMLEKVYPLSNISIMFCYFPERRPENYFYADKYNYTVSISDYTTEWIKNRWQITPDKKIFPPVEMRPKTDRVEDKENIILSVARFDEGSSKKQLEMVKVFARLQKILAQQNTSWQLILAGSASEDNKYVKQIKKYIREKSISDVQLKINLSNMQLKTLYRRAKIFWHLCGLNNNDPALVEHFGITIVEAMQNSVVPVVYNGGGQKEIVQENKNGFLIRSHPALINSTLKLIENNDLRNKFAAAAYERGGYFTQAKFEVEIADFIASITTDYYN